VTELVTTTAKLLPYTKRNKGVPGFATAYFYEPDPLSKQPEATFYAVVEVLAPVKQAEEVADLIIKSFGEAYYNHGEKSDDQKEVVKSPANNAALVRFEAAIKTVNRELGAYTERGYAGWVGRVSAVLAILADSQLHLTQTGSAEAYLYRQGSASHISLDLSPQGPHRPAHTFVHIASGKLEPSDRLIFTTPALVHSLTQPQLLELVEDNSPQSAAAKIAELTSDKDNSDRIAALLVEVTTPEILAMSFRTLESDEVPVGQPDTLLDAAKATAMPLAAQAGNHVTKLAHHGKITWRRLQPHLMQAGTMAAGWLRKRLRTKSGRALACIAVLALVAMIAWSQYASAQAKTVDGLAARYDQIYKQYQQSTYLFETGDKTSARQMLVEAKNNIEELEQSRHKKSLEKRLNNRPHPESAPTKLADLKQQIVVQLEKLEDLNRVAAQLAFDLTNTGMEPAHLELTGSQVVLINGGKSPNISVYNPVTSKLKTGLKTPEGFGTVVATTGTSDSIYLLTDQPAVWLFKPDTDSLVQLSISYGEWPKGKDISAYNGNLYILSDDQIWRHIPTSGGFSGKQAFLTPALPAATKAATAMAVDGSIYLTGPGGSIKRFLAGKETHTVSSLPPAFAKAKSIQSFDEARSLLVVSDDASRLGIISFDNTELRFARQLEVSNAKQIIAAQLDSKRTVFLVSGSKLLKLTLP
jgi:serine/threonine protein phosphatase PrpC